MHFAIFFSQEPCSNDSTTGFPLLYSIELPCHVHACSSANSGLVLYQYTAPPASPHLTSLPLHDADFRLAEEVDANRELIGSLLGNTVRDRDEESVC